MADHGATTEPVRVLAVDDQAIFRRALRQLIEATPGFELAGEAASGREAIAQVSALAPDLVLLDVRMPDMDGVETARRLLARAPGTAVVLISLEPLPQAAGLEDIGVAGFLRKRELSKRRLQALWAEHRPHASARDR
jgi:DNA-binding NarL/FixJ family response regulator